MERKRWWDARKCVSVNLSIIGLFWTKTSTWDKPHHLLGLHLAHQLSLAVYIQINTHCFRHIRTRRTLIIFEKSLYPNDVCPWSSLPNQCRTSGFISWLGPVSRPARFFVLILYEPPFVVVPLILHYKFSQHAAVHFR